MTEKNQFTPEDVGRTFETSKEGITVKLIGIGMNKQYPCLFRLTNFPERTLVSNLIGRTGMRGYYIFPSRPVEEAPSQPTIDTEVEELAREIWIQNPRITIQETFDVAEEFIKFRNERRASHGK